MIDQTNLLPLEHDDPRQIARYAVQGRLGMGGQGVVYLGRDPGGRPVAIKVLRDGGLPAPQARARFAREVDAARCVPQAHTAAILDADVLGERPYIVSEYVPGLSLQAAVERNGVFTGHALERLATHTITALAAIHGARVVHRDFKPANVLIGPDGPRVVDFGIARALESGGQTTNSMVGTPPYMTPEQFNEQPTGPATDVFAWAATVVFAATGRPPFGKAPFAAVANRILHEQPDLGDLAAPLRDVLARCRAKNPAERPTALQVLQTLIGHGTVTDPELRQLALQQPGRPGPAVLPTAPAGVRGARKGLLIAATAAVLVVLGASAVVILRNAAQETPEAAPASKSPEPAAALPAAPSRHWRLGEGTGRQAADSAGSAAGSKLLLYPGARWDGRPPAAAEGALLFDGVKGYAATSGTTVADPARSFTVAARARIDRLPATSAFAAVLSQDSTQDVFAYTLQHLRCTGADEPDGFCPARGSYWTFSVHGTNSFDAERVVAATGAKLGTWVHLTAVYDRQAGPAGEIRIYVDGRLDGVKALTEPVRLASGPFYLGRATYVTPVDFWPGAVADVAVWPRALSNEEVGAAATAG
ncbi:protein kinase domain-containing protein [Nonomuraea zeae]|uniref:Protein kinase domain-containing protein n=1 Tax=Nonomuraea zeae TaxID=1642303 RepID=A0A5S4GBM8_9ACTN|nr:LamG-like jellyroll fold domain-containing protein [Nonomuraea zeae]TMR29924.1 hypothetical protein ETD85_30885 [Nonomuraea zeae]